ncbi:MAG: hypothetical protein DRG69_08095 [Deltaproteobacteria bacterium]|nr:MAG: hypothetical protein DRG69_08095 [Deltaproteobacteria bacterium]
MRILGFNDIDIEYLGIHKGLDHKGIKIGNILFRVAFERDDDEVFSLPFKMDKLGGISFDSMPYNWLTYTIVSTIIRKLYDLDLEKRFLEALFDKGFYMDLALEDDEIVEF